MIAKKITIAILCGGKSAEHEVSLQSAKNILAALDRKKYSPLVIIIDKKGPWFVNKNNDFLKQSNYQTKIKVNKGFQEVVLAADSRSQLLFLNGKKPALKIDAVFPILHGTYGEDGTVQGLLKLADVPFVGAGVLGSAVGMDKDVMKRLLKEARLPIGKFITLADYQSLPDFKKIKKELGLPFFIKPANMGSSVGISKVKNNSQYLPAIRDAFSYDNKIIIEEFIDGREIECSVLGNDQVMASLPGEVKSNHDFYSYQAKYLDEKGAILEIPAKLEVKKTKEIQNLALKTFQVLNCQGLGRVDFFLKNNGQIIINEINTLPGFTQISMYPKLWEQSGLSYSQLIDKLIQLAIERHQKEKKLKTNYFN
ncbi:MAG: D-alanine--D-alanine ligase [Patescibacteria group bacterium]|nr:D-alanine--D-alanine ligase [Patescibacteria group bacterium]